MNPNSEQYLKNCKLYADELGYLLNVPAHPFFNYEIEGQNFPHYFIALQVADNKEVITKLIDSGLVKLRNSAGLSSKDVGFGETQIRLGDFYPTIPIFQNEMDPDYKPGQLILTIDTNKAEQVLQFFRDHKDEINQEIANAKAGKQASLSPAPASSQELMTLAANVSKDKGSAPTQQI